MVDVSKMLVRGLVALSSAGAIVTFAQATSGHQLGLGREPYPSIIRILTYDDVAQNLKNLEEQYLKAQQKFGADPAKAGLLKLMADQIQKLRESLAASRKAGQQATSKGIDQQNNTSVEAAKEQQIRQLNAKIEELRKQQATQQGVSKGGGDGISNFEVMTKGTYPMFSQLRSDDLSLYASTEWAEGNDEERYLAYGKTKQTPHKKFTCLATVYAMIEYARGHSDFRVGPATYNDFSKDGLGAGAQPIPRVSNPHQISVINVPLQYQFLKDHGPIIFKLSIPGSAEEHFILAIGMQNDGTLIANDPLTGSQVHVDPAKKVVIERGWSVTELRLVEF